MRLTTIRSRRARSDEDARRIAPSRPNGLTTLVALIVVGVMPSALGISMAEAPIATLEVRARSTLVESEGCGPHSIVVHVSTDAFVVGEEDRPMRRILYAPALRNHLRRLKDARPERQHVIVRVDDGVAYERVVDVLDMLLALQLQAIDVDVTPAK